MVDSISVMGLGRLGSPLAASFAARGFRVTGVDLDRQKVNCINRGIPSVHEPGLEGLLRESEGRLSATQDAETAIRDSEATFIAVATPRWRILSSLCFSLPWKGWKKPCARSPDFI